MPATAAPAPLASLAAVREGPSAASLLDPLRRSLLAELAEPASAASLARRTGVPRQRLNYHLRELERGGLVECVAARRKGNCVERLLRATARSYIISPELLGSLGPDPRTAGDRLSAAMLLATAGRTIREVAALDAGARAAGKPLATLSLETEIRFATPEARAAFAEELTAAFAALAARYHAAEAPGGRPFRVTAGVHPALPPSALPAAAPVPSPEQSP